MSDQYCLSLHNVFEKSQRGVFVVGDVRVVTIHRADDLRYKVFKLKREQVEATEADTLVSSCSNCRQNFDDCQAHYDWDYKMDSLLELVADNLVEEAA